MPISNKLRRIAQLAEPDVQRVLERQALRISIHDGVRFDDRTGTVVFSRGGAPIWQPRAERIGDWVPDLGLFHWWWHGTKFHEHPRSKLDVIHREGESYQLGELTVDTVTAETAEEAELLAHVALQLLRADGLYRTRQGDRVSYFALFGATMSEMPRTAAPEARPAWLTSDPHEQPVNPTAPQFRPAVIAHGRSISVPPPAGRPALERASPAGRTLPPVAALDVLPDTTFDSIPPPPRPYSPGTPTPPPPPVAPQLQLPVREPSREILMPVAQLALAEVAAATPGFGQALLVVRVEIAPTGKHRFFVQLVATDAEGDLFSLDPSRGLLEAVTKMIADDARDGNGRWSKLAARMRPTARGASIDLDVA
jgi:hypothetical protein